MNHVPPLPESYSRITNPERFAPLQTRAHELLAKLASEYAVDVIETAGDDTQVFDQLGPGILKTVTLRPRSRNSAQLRMAFTDFPGVTVEFGVGTKVGFPACGCDACNEQPETEAERLEWMVENLVAGRFTERVRGLFRKRFEYSTWSDVGREAGFQVLSKNDPRRSLPRRTFHWSQWQMAK